MPATRRINSPVPVFSSCLAMISITAIRNTGEEASKGRITCKQNYETIWLDGFVGALAVGVARGV